MNDLMEKLKGMQMDDAMDVIFLHGLKHKIEGMNGKDFNLADAGKVPGRVLLTVRWHHVEKARMG